jgi:hypothetical protein
MKEIFMNVLKLNRVLVAALFATLAVTTWAQKRIKNW